MDTCEAVESTPQDPGSNGNPENSPLDMLAARSLRLANVVEALSRRRDVRAFRARLLLLLLELRCPPRARPRASWYVPGAVARMGPEGLRRAWAGFTGEEPPTLRTFRAHLGVLERFGAITRSPGDWLPYLWSDEHPEHRPRYPDTIHVLDTDREASWWATAGAELLERHPDARHNPRRWRELFGNWRHTAACLVFEFDAPRLPDLEPCGDVEATVDQLDAVLRRPPDAPPGPLELLSAAARAGVHLHGRNGYALAGGGARLWGALALLRCALARGDRIRNRAGWLVRAFKFAGDRELRLALREVRRAV